MRSFLFISAFAITAPAIAALPVGSTAPALATSAAKAGKAMPFSLANALKKGPVVLYFYPAAFTPGCTIEANLFAEAVPAFASQGATVIGVSGDDIETLKKFSITECRNKFAVAAATPAMIKQFDVALSNGARSNRTSYVIAPNGKVVYSYSSPDYRNHVPNTLAAVKAWKTMKR
jgi:thioredoxin-dependent peroxiredoxin